MPTVVGGSAAFNEIMKLLSLWSDATVAPPESRHSTRTRPWEVLTFGTVHVKDVAEAGRAPLMTVQLVPPFTEYERT